MELVYGKTFRLPGEFFITTKVVSDPVQFVERLPTHMQQLQPKPPCSQDKPPIFAHNELHKCIHVFVRQDSAHQPLQVSYDSPYPVIKRNDKLFKGEHLH
ncbi:uncharacterized protein TNCV_2374151 [Trichonephila clavipes]|nr:uncharacterized protein TNCV_2374151 [Trichonephila clavipes]